VNATDTLYGSRPIHLAARCGHVDVVRYLVEKGVDVNATNFDGSMPIHVATTWNRPDVVRVLRELGANLDLKNKDGCTALDIARTYHPGLVNDLKPVMILGRRKPRERNVSNSAPALYIQSG
jgi:ankyrin repeat protein